MRSGLSGGICRKQGREKWKRSTRAVPLLKSQKIKQGQAGSEKGEASGEEDRRGLDRAGCRNLRVEYYIRYYNTERIQRKLHLMTPAEFHDHFDAAA